MACQGSMRTQLQMNGDQAEGGLGSDFNPSCTLSSSSSASCMSRSSSFVMSTWSSTSSTQSSSADTGLLKNSSTSGSRIAELEAAVGSWASGACSGGVEETSVFK